MIVNVRLNLMHFRADSSDHEYKIGLAIDCMTEHYANRSPNRNFRVFKSNFPQKKAKSFFCGKFFESFYTIFTVCAII